MADGIGGSPTHSGGRRGVTRKDVARFAGVSTAVVSYVVNGGPRPVSPETAQRVRAAVELLGYRPNANARALRRGKTETIGLVLTDSMNPFYSQYAFELVKAASDRGKRLLIGDARHDEEARKEIINGLVESQVDGLLFGFPCHLVDHLGVQLPPEIPTVFIDTADPVPGQRTVGSSAADGAAALVRHLVEHGRRHIGIVIGDEGYGDPDPRETGWRRTLLQEQITDGPIARVPFTREGGYAAGLAMLKSGFPLDAIFASSDLQGVGVVRAVHDSGLRIPEDIAVVSFDGTKESEFCWPALTTAQQDLPELATACIELLSAPVAAEGSRVEIPTRLVLRSSCGCTQPQPTNYPTVKVLQLDQS